MLSQRKRDDDGVAKYYNENESVGKNMKIIMKKNTITIIDNKDDNVINGNKKKSRYIQLIILF